MPASSRGHESTVGPVIQAEPQRDMGSWEGFWLGFVCVLFCFFSVNQSIIAIFFSQKLASTLNLRLSIISPSQATLSQKSHKK